MPTNVSPPPKDEPAKLTKAVGKNKWKDKLFSGEGWRKHGGTEESNTDDVDMFLNGSGPKQNGGAPKFESDRLISPPSMVGEVKPHVDDEIDRFLHHRPLPTEPKGKVSHGELLSTPRRDVNIQQGSSLAPPESDLGPIKDTYRRPRPRMNKGLCVSFTTSAPDVIGEGGDDAELPSREISKSASRLAVNGTTDSLTLRRRSTGFTVPAKKDVPVVQSQQVRVEDFNEKGLRSANHEQSEESRTPAAGLKDASQHAAAFKSELLQPNPFCDPAAMDTQQITQPISHPRLTGLSHAEPTIHSGNSLTPVPSPLRWAEKSHYGFPNVAERATSPPRSLDRVDKRSDRLVEKSRSGSAPEIKPFSLRSVAKALGHDALDEFDLRVRGLFSLFRLGFNVHGDLMSLSLSRWTRIAAWWFIKGRMELESAVRNRSKSADKSNGAPDTHTPRSLMQAYVDLAKAWWIVDEIVPSHPEVKKYGNASMTSLMAIVENLGHRSLAGLVEVIMAIIANMRALTMSMKRNNKLPPQPFEIQGLDSHVLLSSSALSQSTATLVNDPSLDTASTNTFFPLLIGDTDLHFSLGRMFARLSLIPRSSIKAEAQMPSLISIIQNKQDGDFGALIATQDSQVNIMIRSEKSKRSDFTWRLIHWNNATRTMGLPLSHDLDLALELSESDYKMLWDMCDHSRKVQQKFTAHADESLIFECSLQHFERLEMPYEPMGFPQGSIKDCQLRLFSRNARSSGTTGVKVLHDGFRLAVHTGPSVKTPRVLDSEMGGEKLVLLGSRRREDGPCLTVRMPGSPTLLLAFWKQEELHDFRLMMSGNAISKEDVASPPLPLRGFDIGIRSAKGELTDEGDRSIAGLRWRQLQFVERRIDPTDPEVSSSGLRTLAECDYGSFVDRLSNGTGELKMCLSVEDYNKVKILRLPQSDITCSIEDNLPKDAAQSLSQKLQGMAHSATTRTYEFCYLKDVHTFQAAITGFSVRFDGPVSSFSISRRRMVVPLQKKWAAASTRLQILQKEPHSVQLAVFFKAFDHGTCMNFVLKGTDVFETSSKSGSFFLRIVDAKFALPKGPEDPERDFICLDDMEYPSEHDDIIIAFDNEEGKSFRS